MISDDDEAKISKSLIKTDIEIKNKNEKKQNKTENHTKNQKQNETYKTLLILLLMI